MPRKPKGAGAVMADHAPAEVEADTPQMRLHRALNYFPTPPWAARAGGEVIRRLDPEARTAWEPACGEGHMAHGLADHFEHVWCSDIHDHGSSLQAGRVVDFLTVSGSWAPDVDWIVTNPPFAQAEAFVRLGLTRARRGVAVLCRMSWMEGAERFPLLFGETPVTVVAPFSERVAMTLGRWDPKASTATGYAWFIWVKGEALGRHPLILPIGPGTKARLTRPDDARRFGAKAAAPLFDRPERIGDADGGPAEGQAEIEVAS